MRNFKYLIRGGVLAGLVGASIIGGPVSEHSPTTDGVTIVSDQGNISGGVSTGQSSIFSAFAQLTQPQTARADTRPWGYDTLRDNFYTREKCESYRTDYVVNYRYVADSKCSKTKQSNGRYHLWVLYKSCTDQIAEDPNKLATAPSSERRDA